jgi:hypothetical protein
MSTGTKFISRQRVAATVYSCFSRKNNFPTGGVMPML